MEITRKNLQKILKEWSPESEGATPDGMTDKECKYIDTEVDATTRQVVAIIFDDYDEDEEIARSQPFEYKSSLSPKMARLAYNKACNDAKLKLNESTTIRKGNKMKITKKQLKKIISEETDSYKKEVSVYNRDLQVLTKIVNESVINEISKNKLLSESRRRKLVIENDNGYVTSEFLCELADAAEKSPADFIGPALKKAGDFGKKVASGAYKLGKWGMPKLGKLAKRAARGLSRGISKGYSGAKKLYRKAAEGSDMQKLANEDPRTFLRNHKKTEDSIRKIFGGAVRTAADAEKLLGIFQTEFGIEMKDDAAAKAGMSSAELDSVLSTFVHEAEFVDTAIAAQRGAKLSATRAGVAESRVVKSRILKSRIRRAVRNITK